MTERPDLTADTTKPDVLVRLTEGHRLLSDPARILLVNFHHLWLDVGDAITTIKALRDTCDRRLATINELKRELADLRSGLEEGR